MDKSHVAEVLREIAILVELNGENPFKSRSYENAARSIETAPGEIADLVESGELSKLKGIGSGIGEKVVELVTTGHLKYYDELRAAIPQGLLDLTRIPGFGPKKARAVHKALGIESMDSLERAAREGLLEKIPGFGEKSEAKILQGIDFLRRHSGRHLISAAWEAAAPVLEALKASKAVLSIEPAGSLRRRRETIGDIDIVAATERPEEVMKLFVHHPAAQAIIAHGETKSAVTLEGGINCDLRCVTPQEYPFALFYFTGSKDHNVAMRRRARAKGLKLNEYGLYPEGSEQSLRCESEAEIYKALGLPYIPPELREDQGEEEAGEKGKLPVLIEADDIQGLVHFHTTASDGVCTLEEMAAEAQRLGYRYACLSDHSRSAAYAGGLSIDALKKQWELVAECQKKFPNLRILKGIESDILGDGALDYPEDILAEFDFVIASIHSRFTLSKDDMTKRMIAAVQNPYTTILGHPTGRLLLQRDPYEVDLEAVLAAAAKARTAVEINASPHRLDLDWSRCRAAKEAGCVFSIGPDAHDTSEMSNILYGVDVARKGWLTKEDVINCWDAERFLAYKPGRKGKAGKKK